MGSREWRSHRARPQKPMILVPLDPRVPVLFTTMSRPRRNFDSHLSLTLVSVVGPRRLREGQELDPVEGEHKRRAQCRASLYPLQQPSSPSLSGVRIQLEAEASGLMLEDHRRLNIPRTIPD